MSSRKGRGGDRATLAVPVTRLGQRLMKNDTAGYAQREYAFSLQEFGRPRELCRSGGWVLERTIPGTPYKDAIGCYPVFACRDWSRLHEDLEHLRDDLVSLALVVDPFADVSRDYLNGHFDIVRPFKTHYIANLAPRPETFVDREHRRYARRSLEKMDVEICHEPARFLDEWINLYGNLSRRHAIKGLSAFSRQCFEEQLNMNGMMMILGRRGRDIMSASLVLVSGSCAYVHLSATSIEGYRMRAAYGIRWTALVYCREHGIRYLDMGGNAGIKDDPRDGLSQFKKGWSNEQRMASFCGSIFDRGAYESVCNQYHVANREYFPAYRGGAVHTEQSSELSM